MSRCLLALGSNLGDKHYLLRQACADLANLSHCKLLARSRWHGTTPIGGAAGQGEFLNGALLLETRLEPHDLAAATQRIESRLGRERAVRWDARTIDIDILLFGKRQIDAAELTIPHPRMTFRKFVLEPAAEIAGDMLHPIFGWSIARLLTHLRNTPRYVVVTAKDSVIAERLISQLTKSLGCQQWLDAEESWNMGHGSRLGAGIELPADARGVCPIIAMLSPDTLEQMSKAILMQREIARPALVIVHDAENDSCERWWNHPGLGALARITADDFDTIAQEAEAALRCVWPDL